MVLLLRHRHNLTVNHKHFILTQRKAGTFGMKILFHIAHPAQYHMFKNLIKNLQSNGHIIKITINTKDILEQLMREDGVQYENILPQRRTKNNKLATLLTLIKKDLKVFKLQLHNNYDLMVGTETALSHNAWLFRKPVFIMVEDDITVIKDAARISFPFAKHIVSPVTCNLGKWSKKKIEYDGYQKTAYLHPNYFMPKKEIITDVIKDNEGYVLIRVSGLSAYHDKGIQGFTVDILRDIVSLLKAHKKILLSTERELPEDLRQYSFKTKFSNIHHFLYYADFLIADSQSMCVEAALLGTPSIRFSDFAGEIGVLEELEHKYGLTFGIKSSQQDKLLNKINELLAIKNIKGVWQEKRRAMLKDKIDVTSFWTWLIENYPKSITVLKEDPTYQHKFK